MILKLLRMGPISLRIICTLLRFIGKNSSVRLVRRKIFRGRAFRNRTPVLVLTTGDSLPVHHLGVIHLPTFYGVVASPVAPRLLPPHAQKLDLLDPNAYLGTMLALLHPNAYQRCVSWDPYAHKLEGSYARTMSKCLRIFVCSTLRNFSHKNMSTVTYSFSSLHA